MNIGEYPRLGRATPFPTLLGILNGVPALQVSFADIKGFIELTGASSLLAGGSYRASLAGGPFTIILPALADVNDGDTVEISVDRFAPTSNLTLAASGSDQISEGGDTSPTLICDVAGDHFRVGKFDGVWKVM